MDICLIMDNPETPNHPIIGAALTTLKNNHDVRLLDVRGLMPEEAIAHEQAYPLADLYLLKSHAIQALELAHHLEQQGAKVMNSWESSLACQNRVQMSQRMKEAGLPWPQTQAFPSLQHLLEQHELLATMNFPVIIKSFYSYRGDLVGKIDTVKELQALKQQWGDEPVVLQEFAAGDGWDIKIWVVGEHIYAARRRTPLATNASKEDIPIAASQLPGEWLTITREVGRVFQLRLYGLDLLSTQHGPMIVDINAFPGFRGVPGADEALVGLVERALHNA